jgi:hypothetical protein
MELDGPSLWAQCPLPLYQLDAKGRVLALNPSMAALMGVNEVSTLPPPMRLPDGAGGACRRLWRSHEGTGRLLSASERPDGVGHIWGTVLDTGPVQPASLAPETAAAQRDEALLAMAHDLRSPLNAILGFAEVLMHAQTENATGPVGSAGRHIAAAGERLLLNLDGLLDLARLRLERMPFNPGRVQPQAMWSQAQELLHAEVQLREVRLETEGLADSSAAWVHADPVRVQQLMAQSLSWMLRAARPGQRLVARWAFSSDGGTWRWQLEGPCPSAFAHDQQGTNAMVRTLCEQLAQRLGGHFSVDSGLGRLGFELPAHLAAGG